MSISHEQARAMHKIIKKKRIDKDYALRWRKGFSGEMIQVYQPRGARKH